MTAKYTAVGTTDECTTCDCCGKANLKMTVVLRDDEGDFHFFGRSCAARATGWRAAHLEREVTAANHKRARTAKLVETWNAYLNDGEAGVTRFIENNRVACADRYRTREAVAAMIRKTCDELAAEYAALTGR